ncbi:unnamed protein product [Staurois parvus]|uniref:Pentraxin family member n=1 Tax=Staurois parvus TaxID=386267 RepID=A0ABN9GRU5_9NEOB|nr:unnamed protein product [Staurois parvus]
MFFFPKETSTARVILRPTITKPLQKVSICLRTFSELSRGYALLSGATSKYFEAFLIMFYPPDSHNVYINNGLVVIKTTPEPLDWRHTCMTWDSDTGLVQFWVNGNPYPGGFSSKGSSITTDIILILGQEQDSFGGGFDAKQSLVGEISDIHMWDYVLTQEDIQKVLSGDLHGNIINWKSLLYEIKGEVLVQPKNLRKSFLLIIYTLIIKILQRSVQNMVIYLS